jgi:hypothetical protein
MNKPDLSSGQSIILRTKSHRARERLERTIGRHPQFFWTWEDGGCFAEVTMEEYERVKGIKGITKASVPRESLRKCWS